MSTMRFSVLPVGQGTGTLVEVLDDTTGKPLEISLVDLGSKGWEKERTGVKSAEFIVERLRAMDEPRLEAVFLSHGDEDHINLVVSVLDKFFKPSQGQPRNLTLEIENLFYAGSPSEYVKDGVDILGEISKWWISAPDGIRALGTRSPGAPMHVSTAGVSYVSIVQNTIREIEFAGATKLTRRGAPGYLRNLVSLVLAVGYGGSGWIVATGDATGLTLLDTYKALCGDPGMVPAPILSLTLPHHGSASTTYDFLGMTELGVEPKKFAEAILAKLTERLDPQSLSVSAGEVGRYKHPRAMTIGTFGAGLPVSEFTDPLAGMHGKHFYTAYFGDPHEKKLNVVSSTNTGTQPSSWPASPDWYTVRTDKAVFTTDYFRQIEGATADVPDAFPPNVRLTSDGMDTDPPGTWVTGWAWEVDQNGTGRGPTMIVRQDPAAAAYLTLLERVHGPFPDDLYLFLPSAPADAPLDLERAPEPARVASAMADPAAPAPLDGRCRIIR